MTLDALPRTLAVCRTQRKTPARSRRTLSLLIVLLSAIVVAIGGTGTAHAAVLSAGTSHVCAVSAGGAAECWGSNDYGQLGDGNTSDSSTPMPVQGLGTGVTSVSAGDTFSCAIQTGTAKCWGTNFYGLGGGASHSTTPLAVTGLESGVTDISVGKYHACAIVSGAVKCWGQDLRGELGDGHSGFGFDSPTPVSVTGLAGPSISISSGWYRSCALVGNSVKCWGDGYSASGAVQITGFESGVTAISDSGGGCGVQFGAVKCWHANIADGLSSGVTSVSSANDAECAIVAGAVKCWGFGRFGSLGNGGGNEDGLATAVQVSGATSGAVAVTTGRDFACAIVASEVRCWGKNLEGQLGIGTDGGDSQSTVPIDVMNLPPTGVTDSAVGSDHQCAVISGAVKCWGDSVLGDGTATSSPSPVPMSGLTSNVSSVAAGNNQSCAIVAGAAECWGFNSLTPTPVIGAASDVTAIAVATRGLVCAVISGAAKCWGSGVLGDGATTESATPVQVLGLETGVTAISVGGIDASGGEGYACAIQAGAAKCWGENSSAQLGNGTTTDSSVPVSVTGLSTGVSSISTGVFHACAVIAGGAKCWGVNSNGQLGNGQTGNGTTTNSEDPVLAPVQVSGLTTGVTNIAVAGEYDDVSKSGFSCAVVSGAVKCWGINKRGSLGDGTTTRSTTPVQVVGLTSGATSVSAGSSQTEGWRACAVVSGALKCWGDNAFSTFGSADSWHATPQTVSGFMPGAVEVITPITPPVVDPPIITPPSSPPSTQPTPTSQPPTLGKIATIVRANKPIAIPISCTTACTIGLTLRLGKKKIKLPSVKVPAGTTTGAPVKVTLSAKIKKQIKSALKKKKKVTLVILPTSASGNGARRILKVK